MATATKSKKPAPLDDAPEQIFMDDIGVVDTATGEIVEAAKAPAPSPTPKLPYGISLLEGQTCPECGAQLARTKREGKRWDVCTKQFAEEPECWYARELPKDGGETTESAAADPDTSPDTASEPEPGDTFFDGGAELGGAQMKTAAKTETDGGDAPSDKTTSSKTTTKGKKK